MFRDDPLLALQTSYPISTKGMTRFIQLCIDSRTAIGLATSSVNSFAMSVISGYLDDVGFQDVSARHRTHYYPPQETDTSNLLEMLLGDLVQKHTLLRFLSENGHCFF